MSDYETRPLPPQEQTIDNLAQRIREAGQKSSPETAAIPHGKDPVTYGFEKTPLAHAPVNGEAPVYPPANLTQQRIPEHIDAGAPYYGGNVPHAEMTTSADKRRFPIWARLVAGAATVGAAVGITYAVTRPEDNAKPAPRAVGTVSAPKTTGSSSSSQEAKKGPQAPDYGSATVDQKEINLTHPNTISGLPVAAGNVSIGESFPGEPGITVQWHGKDWLIPKLVYPGNKSLSNHFFNTQDLGNAFLSNYAALMSLDPNSRDFAAVLNNFTDNARVKERIIEDNKAFQALRIGDKPYSNQDIVFDTSTNPVTFEDTGTNLGDTMLSASSDIYSRPLSESVSTAQNDATAFVPGETQLLKNVRFGYHVSRDGFSVKVGVLGLDVVG